MKSPRRLLVAGLKTLHLMRRRAGVIFYVYAPDYTDKSAGARCLHLLCHHLNRLGYDSLISTRRTNPALNTPFLHAAKLDRFRRRGMSDIVIYPEVIAGNPLRAERVVRYLLNSPGHFTGVGAETYGSGDFIIHFWDEFLPPRMKSLRLSIPTVNQEVYCLPNEPVTRNGFAVYAHRHQLDVTKFPDWVTNLQEVSSSAPRTPPSLASLYQRSRALITGERTAASFEAILCGCPVIVIPNEKFNPEPTLRRYGGNGFCVGFDRDKLEDAARTVPQARAKYQELVLGLDGSIHSFVENTRRYFAV